MRKAILGVIAVLFLAGVSYAVPSGLDGTVYLTAADKTANTQTFYYFDLTYNSVTSNYSATAATQYGGPITDNEGYDFNSENGTGQYPGAVTAWYNSNGKLDMAGSYHNGYLLTSAAYNGASPIADLLQINPDGTVTILNDGVTGTARTTTNGVHHALTVDSGFTGSGPGILTYQYSGGKTSAVWTYDSNAGTYTTAADPGHQFFDGGSDSGVMVNVGPMNQLVAPGKHATGLAACTGQFSGTSILMEYKIATSDGGGFMAMTDIASNIKATNLVPIPYGGSTPKILSADTNADGLLDVYYMGQASTTAHGSGYRWIHCQDNTQDGLFDAAGEAVESNVLQFSGGAAQLVQLPDNNANGKADDWAVVEWQTGSFRIYGLDSNGNYATGTSQNLAITGAGTVVGTYTLVPQDLVFLPIGQSAQAPEPGTLLLLGTGALGLAGILRRRFMS